MPQGLSRRDEQEVRRLLDGIEVYVPEEKQRVRRRGFSLERALAGLFSRFGTSGTFLLLGLAALVVGNVFRITFPFAAPLLGIAAAGCLAAALIFAFRGNRQRAEQKWRGRDVSTQPPGLLERLRHMWQSRQRF